MGKHIQTIDQRIIVEPENTGVPTQVANPRRAVLRTVVASIIWLILALPIANLILSEVAAYLQEQTSLEVAPWVWLAVNGALATVTFITGLVTRVLAVPAVNAWLTAHLPILAPIKPAE